MVAANHPPGAGEASGSHRLVLRYDIGGRVVRVTQLMPGRWAVALDEEDLAGSYRSSADAWEAGVREADKRKQP